MKWMEDGCERLAAWMEAVCSRPSCVDTLPPADEICDSYGKLVERMKAMSAGARKEQRSPCTTDRICAGDWRRAHTRN